jgi:hypothetical protein
VDNFTRKPSLLSDLLSVCPDGAHVLGAAFRGDPHTVQRGAWMARTAGPGTVWETDIGPLNKYLCVSAFNEPVCRKTAFVAQLALMVDDIGGTIPLDKLPADLSPTWLIETSPENYQAWYVLADPITDMGMAGAMVSALQAKGFCKPDGGDTGFAAVTRWGRCERGVNGKPGARDEQGKPWQVRGERQNGLVTVQEVLDAFGITADDLKTRRKKDAAAGPGPQSDLELNEAARSDTLAQWLAEQGLVQRWRNDGWLDITCPWVEDHSGGDSTGTSYRLARFSGSGKGGFKCHHGSHIDRTLVDLWAWAEAEGWQNPWAVPDAVVEFEPLDEAGESVQARTAHDIALDYCDKIFSSEKALRDCAVELLNKHYCVLVAGGKTGIAHWAEDPRHPPDVKPGAWGTLALSVSSTADMGILFANSNWMYRTPGPQSRIRALNPFDAWMQHPDRRTKTGLAFGPGADPAALNLHFGPGVTPRPGDWSLYYKLIEEGICGNEPDPPAAAADLIRLFAWKMQHPGDHSEKIIVLRGSPGAGKTSMASIFEKVFGPSYVQTYTNPQHVFGRFNPEMAHTAVIVLNESFWAGNHQDEASLKSFADATLLLEMKYGPKLKVPNHALLILLGNADWLIPVREGDRRAVAYNVADRFMQDHGFFKRLWTQMENGGFEALCHHLLTLDLGDWNPRDMKPTKGTQRQRSLSADPTEQWALALADDFAQAWCGLERARSQGGDWVELGSLTAIHSAFKAWAVHGLSRHDKQPGAQELVTGLRKLLGKDTLVKRRPRGNMPRVWSLGLGKMREVLARKFPDHFED